MKNMYLHIGNNNMILESSIIGIFNINSLKKNEKYKEQYEILINKMNQEKKIIYVDNNIKEKDEKTLILIREKNIIKAYISNISAITIAKRK